MEDSNIFLSFSKHLLRLIKVDKFFTAAKNFTGNPTFAGTLKKNQKESIHIRVA